jgi:hypothetical protein
MNAEGGIPPGMQAWQRQPIHSIVICRNTFQNYVIDDVRGMSSNPVRTTGLSECWFYSIEGFWNAFAEPRYADFRVDEQRFLDINDLLLVFASAATIFGKARIPHSNSSSFTLGNPPYRQKSSGIAGRTSLRQPPPLILVSEASRALMCKIGRLKVSRTLFQYLEHAMRWTSFGSTIWMYCLA